MSQSAPIDSRQESVAIPQRLLTRIPLPLRMLVYGVAFLALMLVGLPALFFQLDLLIPQIHFEIGLWRWVGVALFAGFLAAYLACSYVLTSRGQGAYVEFDPPTKLVVVGPYRYTRNPVAATLMGAILGLAIALSSTGVLLMFVIFSGLAHLQVLRVEEPLLMQRYGADYEAYCRTVPRWLPRLGRAPALD